jgi:hypothetical protein
MHSYVDKKFILVKSGCYTRSPTPTTILVVACHATPATCTPRDKQTQFSKQTRDKDKTPEMSRIQIKTSPSQ